MDLLFNGGIGTYIKAETESDADVGDRANDTVRVNGNQVRAKVIGEGGNLGVTSLGRVEFDLAGGRINTDALDNSAGVDCSDHEVNIKILIDSLVSTGQGAARRAHGSAAVDDRRGRPAGARRQRRPERPDGHQPRERGQPAARARPADQGLVAERGLNRELEALPSEKEIRRRTEVGIGLTSPELATLMAHVKLALKDEVLASDLPDQEVFAARLPRVLPDPAARRVRQRDPLAPTAPRDRHHDAGQRPRRHRRHHLRLPGHRGRRGRTGGRGAALCRPPTRSSASSEVWRSDPRCVDRAGRTCPIG